MVTKFVNPKVTVIIPVYNCQNSIKQAIRSIQNQKMINIEIMLVNDKSNDDSIKIIQNIQKTDRRIKLTAYTQLDKGYSIIHLIEENMKKKSN